MGPNQEETAQQIAQFSTADAAAYPHYQAKLERIAEVLEPILMQPAPQLLPLPASWRKRKLTTRLQQSRQLWNIYKSLGTLEADLPETVELLLGAARPLLERWFESEVLRATLATDAIIGAFSSISAAGTAYVLLHHVMGRATGERGVWGYVQGGMGGLADALEASCKELRVEIVRECEVLKILVESGRVAGVAVDGGRTIKAATVASSIDANWTFRRLVDDSELPTEFTQAIDRIDYSSASAKINLALGEVPRFRSESADQVGPEHQGTIHISPTLDYIEQA
jgi:phytoene dehydrogenase-like protein